MNYVTTNPNMKQILDDFNINPETTNVFQHAFWPEQKYDPDACKPYFENGLRLKMGFDSFLATMSPYSKKKSFSSEIENDSFRGDHKIIVCIPHELENMFFGSVVGANGDAGNQYQNNILLDYLVHHSKTNHLPSEFILGMYIKEGEDGKPACFIENPLFYKNKNNSQINTENLKNKLLTALEGSQTSSLSKDLIKYCFGCNDLSEEEINKKIEILDKFFKDSTYDVLKQVVSEKVKKEKSAGSPSEISLDDLMIKF